MKKNLYSFCHKHGRCTAITKIMVLSILMLIIINAMACTALAAGPLSDANLIGENSPLYTLYSFFLKISIPIAAVGFTMCAFSFFIPNEKGYEIAKKRMLNIGIAIMVIFLIPSIYKFASNGVKDIGWKPGDANTQIIENAGESIDIRTVGPTPIPDGESPEATQGP